MMNANGLSKLYDRLQPHERVPLWLAAGARGDKAEQERLDSSAPKKALVVADSYCLLLGLRLAASAYMITQLDLASWFWMTFGALASKPESDGERSQALRMAAF